MKGQLDRVIENMDRDAAALGISAADDLGALGSQFSDISGDLVTIGHYYGFIRQNAALLLQTKYLNDGGKTNPAHFKLFKEYIEDKAFETVAKVLGWIDEQGNVEEAKNGAVHRNTA